MLFRFRTTLGVGKESDRVIDDSDETEQVGEAERIGRLGARRRNYGTEGQAEPEDCSTKVCKKNGFVHMGGWQTRRNSARQLILILESTCRTSSSSNAGVERGRWIFTASISLLALIARRWLLSWCDLGLRADALDLSMTAEDTCECDGTIRRSGSGGTGA